MSEQANAAAVTFRREATKGCLNLRGDPADAGFQQGVAAVLGLNPPLPPCTFRQAGDATLYWLAPDEWLAMMPDGVQSEREEELRRVLHGYFSVVDVSGAYQLFRLAGPDAQRVLQKSSPYDFHPHPFAPGSCVQTVFGKTTALVARHPRDVFDLLVRTSYADYVHRWVAAAAEEYGLATEAASHP